MRSDKRLQQAVRDVDCEFQRSGELFALCHEPINAFFHREGDTASAVKTPC
jgi:hypothetical protein